MGDDTFAMGPATFQITVADRFRSSDEHFMLVKSRALVDRYVELIAVLGPQRIVELGICEGGSTAFLSLLAEPERMLALDLRATPAAGLETFIERHGRQDQMHTHYSFDQSDDGRLRRMLDEEFGDQPLDLVIDDASHRVSPTRASFNVLFPRLRPGGVYVIEDWNGVHQLGATLERRAETDEGLRRRLEQRVEEGGKSESPLSVFLFELILASAYHPDVFVELLVTDAWAQVVRGPGVLDPDTFDVSQAYSKRSRRLIDPDLLSG
jgi:predicted O-methyltransferase YrrM